MPRVSVQLGEARRILPIQNKILNNTSHPMGLANARQCDELIAEGAMAPVDWIEENTPAIASQSSTTRHANHKFRIFRAHFYQPAHDALHDAQSLRISTRQYLHFADPPRSARDQLIAPIPTTPKYYSGEGVRGNIASKKPNRRRCTAHTTIASRQQKPDLNAASANDNPARRATRRVKAPDASPASARERTSPHPATARMSDNGRDDESDDPMTFVLAYCRRHGLPDEPTLSDPERAALEKATLARELYKAQRSPPPPVCPPTACPPPASSAAAQPAPSRPLSSPSSSPLPVTDTSDRTADGRERLAAAKYKTRLRNNRKSAHAAKVFKQVMKRELSHFLHGLQPTVPPPPPPPPAQTPPAAQAQRDRIAALESQVRQMTAANTQSKREYTAQRARADLLSRKLHAVLSAAAAGGSGSSGAAGDLAGRGCPPEFDLLAREDLGGMHVQHYAADRAHAFPLAGLPAQQPFSAPAQALQPTIPPHHLSEFAHPAGRPDQLAQLDLFETEESANPSGEDDSRSRTDG